MVFYPMRLEPNVEEDKIIIDPFYSSLPGQSVASEAIKSFILYTPSFWSVANIIVTIDAGRLLHLLSYSEIVRLILVT